MLGVHPQSARAGVPQAAGEGGRGPAAGSSLPLVLRSKDDTAAALRSKDDMAAPAEEYKSWKTDVY